jgi:hypothetical protein
MYTVESPDKNGIWSSETVGDFSRFETLDEAIECMNDHIERYGTKCRIVDDNGEIVEEV